MATITEKTYCALVAGAERGAGYLKFLADKGITEAQAREALTKTVKIIPQDAKVRQIAKGLIESLNAKIEPMIEGLKSATDEQKLLMIDALRADGEKYLDNLFGEGSYKAAIRRAASLPTMPVVAGKTSASVETNEEDI